MDRKIVSGLMLALLFITVLTSTFYVPLVKASSGTIYIRADGSIDPLSAPIQRNGSIYTLIDNINNSIVIEKGLITIDGNGHILQGSGSYGSEGIHVSEVNNVTIMNLSITKFWYGICLYSTPPSLISGGKITNNNVSNNDYGVYLEYASITEVSKNIVSGNHEMGITLYYSTGNEVRENNILDNNCGIQLQCSSNNRLRSNNMTNNSNNFRLDGICPLDFVDDVDISNTVDNKPIYYWVKESDLTVPLDAGCVVLVNCTRITVENLTLTKNNAGIFSAYSTYSTINLNTIENNSVGILFISSSYNYISQNKITNIGGILFSSSSNNTINGNNITGGDTGIEIEGSSNNSISGNSFYEMEFGIDFESSHNSSVIGNYFAGVNAWSMEIWSSYDNKIGKNKFMENEGALLVYDSARNLIEENNLTNTNYGIGMSFSSNNRISGNRLSGCTHYGVWLYSSLNNLFYHNNFINNTPQVQFSSSCKEFWDNGGEGNYWSNYNGTDANQDGIGDTPYVIDANNADRYPLMGPFNTFDVGTWNGVAYGIDTVSNSTITNLSFNATAKTLSFNVTGANGTMGFCRVAIPKAFMSCANPDEWTVTVNNQPVQRSIANDTSYTYIYFTYTHSTKTVQIQSTNAVPEFQTLLILSLLMTMTLLAALGFKKRRNRLEKTRA